MKVEALGYIFMISHQSSGFTFYSILSKCLLNVLLTKMSFLHDFVGSP